MANYIDKNILCQGYIHIEPLDLDEREYEDLKKQIKCFIEERGKFFLYADRDITESCG